MGAPARKIDTDALLAGVDLVQVVGAYVRLKKNGTEWVGCCPFHEEKTPSFCVSPVKGFVHCFGCGAHHDAIGFVMAIAGVDFVEACKRLGAASFEADPNERRAAPTPAASAPDALWVPLLPVPDDAPGLMCDSGWTRPIWNPKRDKFSRFKPAMVFPYRNGEGRLLGYVLRCEFDDGKITPQVTWCVGPCGAMQWCLTFFPAPRPLFGLDALAARPDAPVLLLEGEKCALAGAGALPMYAAVAWPGGSKGVPYVDWSPLRGRDVVMWPDADAPGIAAMLGDTNLAGDQRPGVAQFLHRAGVRSLRFIDTTGQPKGWDIADAVRDGWTGRQIAAWAASRVMDVNVRSQG